MPTEMYNGITKDPHSIYAAMDPVRLAVTLEARDESTPGAESGRRQQNVQIRMVDRLQHGSTPGCSKCRSASRASV